jgi:replicative DNA helicase
MATLPSIADVSLQKSLPHSPEAERAVLGAILLDNSLFDQASELLGYEDFYEQSHQKIFSRMALLSAASEAIDTLTLRSQLQKANALEEIGGAAYIASLLDGVPRVANIENYARIVKEKSVLRKLIHSAHSILLKGFAAEESPMDLLDEAERRIFEIGQERMRSGFIQLSSLLPDTYNHIETLSKRKELITGVPTGFIELDNLTSGLQPTDLIIVAARPGCGKTSFALNIAQHASVVHAKSVGVFSLEMSSRQLVTRMLCSEARVDNHRVRAGRISNQDWGELAKAMSYLSQARLFIDDTAGSTMMEIRSKARRLKSEHGLDLLIVDYLQLMSGKSGDGRRFESREKEIAFISRSMKGLAKELDVPIIAVSQLSRAPEQRAGNHRPQLSDLRESGSIEQDADVVLFIYREDMYRKKDDMDEESGIAEIIIGKQRNGPTDRVKLAFITEWTKFENLAYDNN